MRDFFIDAYCNCENHNFSGHTIRVTLSDSEAQRLISVASNPKTYYGRFYRCEELKDIYDKIYKEAVEQMTDLYRFLSTTDKRFIKSDEWRIDDTFECWVEFPKEIEKLIPWYKRKGQIHKLFKFIDKLYEAEVFTFIGAAISFGWLAVLIHSIDYDSVWQGIFVCGWATIMLLMHCIGKMNK